MGYPRGTVRQSPKTLIRGVLGPQQEGSRDARPGKGGGLVPVSPLEASRDAWRREASKPRHTLTDLAGAALVGYGVARPRECTDCLLVGSGLIVGPRLIAALGRLDLSLVGIYTYQF